jgi:hypothetical protein
MTEREARAIQGAFARACFGRDRTFETDLRRYLADAGVPQEDVEAWTASPRRLGLYRRLLRHNVVNVIEAMLPRTKVRMDAVANGAFDAAIDAFLDESGPQTAHLRDVPREFLAFALPRLRTDARLPPWIGDHAELELVDFVVAVAPRPPPPPPLADVSADRPLVFGEPKVLLRLGWSVHEEAVTERDVALLVYRDRDHRSRYLELTHAAALILERLFAGEALGPAMVAASEAGGFVLDESVLAGAARLLSDLGERGVLLGARSA